MVIKTGKKAYIIKDFKLFPKKNKRGLSFERMKVPYYIVVEEMYFNVDDLYLAMRTENTKISRSPVYRAFRLLCEAGLLLISNIVVKYNHACYLRA